MLRIHCLQLWWKRSHPAIEEALHERPLYGEIAGLAGTPRLTHETTILRILHLLKRRQLAQRLLELINAGLAQQGLLYGTGSLVDARLISAPSSTTNTDSEHDPQRKQNMNGSQWYFA